MREYRDYNKFNKKTSFGTISDKNQRFPWYLVRRNAQQRCNNPNATGYKNYGGRGIKFFITLEELKQLWFRDKAFEMKHPSIDRIDNNGHYTFENCRFIELSENIKKSHKSKIK